MKFNLKSIFSSVCVILCVTQYTSTSYTSDKQILKRDYLREAVVDCENGLYNYRFYPYDCQKYFACYNKELTIKSCPSEYFWNERIKACDVQENVDCSNIIPYPNPDCSDGTNTYFLYPYNCSMFYECYNYKLYLLTCPEESFWNVAQNKCLETDKDCSHIIPQPVTKPTEAPQTTQLTTTTTTTEATTTSLPLTTRVPPTRPPLTTPKFECTYANQYFPDPYNCTNFYECSNYVAVLLHCPGNQYWNDKIKVCDWPFNVDCVPLT